MSYKKRADQKYHAELRKQKKLEKQQLQNSFVKSEKEQENILVSKRNIYGIRDLTPYNAFLLMDGEDEIEDIVFR